MTNDILQVGIYTVTITIGLALYPTVTPYPATYTLEVYDNCATAIIDNLGQAVGPVSYVVLLAPGPTVAPFNPFSDNVAAQYLNPTICGPKAYTIVEAYPFVAIVPPASGVVETDPWSLSVETPNIPDVGIYTATLECTLVNYPLVPPVSLAV